MGPDGVALHVERLLRDAVAHVVERVLHVVAEAVLDVREASRIVVGILDEASVRHRHFRKRARGVVVVRRHLVAGGRAAELPVHEPAARGVVEQGLHARRVYRAQQPARRIVVRELGHLPQGVGHRREVARGIVGHGRDVAHVRARPVDREHLAVGVVRVAPDTRGPIRRRGERRGTRDIGRGLDRLGAEQCRAGAGGRARHARLAVVAVRRDAQRLGHRLGKAARRMPLCAGCPRDRGA